MLDQLMSDSITLFAWGVCWLIIFGAAAATVVTKEHNN